MASPEKKVRKKEARPPHRMRMSEPGPIQDPSSGEQPDSLHSDPFRSLPDAHALFRRQVQRVARLHVERGVPRIEVAYRTIGAELPRRVRVGLDQVEQCLV